jgi:hypothetical protein
MRGLAIFRARWKRIAMVDQAVLANLIGVVVAIALAAAGIFSALRVRRRRARTAERRNAAARAAADKSRSAGRASDV